MNLNKIALGLVAAGFSLGVVPTAFAADADRIATLEQQLKILQQEIEALKKSSPTTQEVQELRNQVEAQGKEAVVLGDVPNSIRTPGSDTSVRVYGIAELNMVHEAKGASSANDYSTFAPYLPLNDSANGKRTGQTYLHARTSRIGLEGATPSPYGQVSMKIEADFNNDPRTGNAAVEGSLANIYTQQATNSYNLRLRQAYLQIGPWLFGQTWSTFMDLDNTPETVDFNGPIGSTFIRQPQIRYTYTTPSAGNFSVALENSSSYVLDSTGVATTAGFSRVPDLVARWDRSFDWGSVSLRAVSHELRLNDGAGLNLSRRGTGLAASGMLKAVGDDYVNWMITGGTGIGRYFNYIEGAGYDAAANHIALEKSVGVVLGYQHKVDSQLRFNFVYGWQKSYDNEYTVWAGKVGMDSGQYAANRRVSQLHIGGYWNPIKVVDIGLEYIYGQRETLANQKGEMSRLNFLARYNFN